MKLLATITGVALFVCGVSAQQAVVTSSCNFTVYVQSFPYDGSTPGTLTAVPPGGRFAEDFRETGSTVKISKTRTLSTPLFFGYSFSSSPDYAYCKPKSSYLPLPRFSALTPASFGTIDEFSTEWGNPFADEHNVLTPGEGCELFDCAAGEAACYSTPAAKKVYGCPQPVNLEAELCLED
ncbi:hypothetical protein NPX13_g3081 [Xylaria arbuscula]|uniref:Uncharacterized protein n=1 Tax=Xylaria arbuscula TaxID=114810 RepID=A0A9W8NHZ1_9PEZI|nr:hypothetical protein NPX13_g3081 [Xylaria arbuscula]